MTSKTTTTSTTCSNKASISSKSVKGGGGSGGGSSAGVGIRGHHESSSTSASSAAQSDDESSEGNLASPPPSVSMGQRPTKEPLFGADDDVYNTLFTKALSCSGDLNSTFLSPEFNRFRERYTTSGGSETPKTTISDSPSDSSFGFQNTYSVLEQQLASKTPTPALARQLRDFVKYNEFSKTPVFCNASLLSPRNHSANYLRSISEESESCANSRRSSSSTLQWDDEVDKAEKPSFLELELEASSRLRMFKERYGGSTSSIDRVATTHHGEEKIEVPLVEALYGIDGESLARESAHRVHPNPEIFLESDSGASAVGQEQEKVGQGDYPEYIYHVAKGNDGRMYLKVVRNVLLDKVLCGNRVSQMTRTYDDIDAVTRLLEEKEKDLELTVQIGKELLTQNTHLESRVSELEQELKSTTENLSQLAHELHQKNELIGILTNDVDDSSENVTPTVSKSVNLELLQRKVKSLEDENKSLRTEAAQLVKETDECEEQERKLMADIANQLNSANSEFDGLNLELERLKEENRLQHEQIISLTSRLSEAEIRLHQLTTENEEASSLLSITKENQNLLASELAEFKARYQEVLNLLNETQEQLRRQRKRSQPMARSSLIPGMGVPIHDSLQSELMETSLYSDNSLDSGIASERGGPSAQMASYKKVFETVRSATRANSSGFSDGFTQLGSMTMSSVSQPRMSPYIFPGTATGTTATNSYKSGSSIYSTMYESSLGGRTFSRESLVSDSEDGYPGGVQTGNPGAPGAKDLEAALKRLTPAEILARRAMLQHAPAGTYSYDEQPSGMPLGCRTPDSIMSTGSSGLSGVSSNQWRLPEKLQIVKPIEGSQTLHHWSRLATPTLSGLLEERPGVTIRGGRGLDELGLQTYSLSDVEEDAEEHPGKRFQTYGCTYTYTNSTVMHPDDGTMAVTFSLPPSQMSSQLTSQCVSRQPSCPSTPRSSLSRRNSCSTFSVNMGLASMLNERGIKAVTPSVLNTPAGQNYSPTVTPCNSPEERTSRPASPETPLLAGLLASGADILRKKFAAASSSTETERPSRMTARNKLALSRLEKKALRSIKIMEKVESMGMDNFMPHPGHGISPLALHGSSALYNSTVRGRTSSPMAQLTSLKHLQENRMKNQTPQQDGLLIDKETIKAVLSKGLSQDSLKNISSGASDVSSVASGAYADSDSGSSVSAVKPTVVAQKIKQQQQVEKENRQESPATAARLKQMQRQKSRRSLLNGANGSQRPDLGKVNGMSRPGVRPDLGTVGNNNKAKNNSKKETSAATGADTGKQAEQQQQQPTRSLGQSVYGTISSLLFGRKGGLL